MKAGTSFFGLIVRVSFAVSPGGGTLPFASFRAVSPAVELYLSFAGSCGPGFARAMPGELVEPCLVRGLAPYLRVRMADEILCTTADQVSLRSEIGSGSALASSNQARLRITIMRLAGRYFAW